MSDFQRTVLLTAVAIALEVRDIALTMNRKHGFDMFEPDAMPEAFVGALEAQDPPFTVAPLLNIDRKGERAALAAGTHQPAVDDFGNQYLHRLEQF